MRIILTGAKGQVGQEIKKQTPQFISNQLVNLFVFDHQDFDIVDETKVTDIVHKIKPDLIINAAAYTAVDRAEAEPELAYAVNEVGPLNLAKACQSLSIPLIHLSTDYVFTGNKALAYTEEDSPEPLNTYGKSKLNGELAVSSLLEKHIILRTSWVFGLNGHNFVKTILKLAKEKSVLKIVSDQKGSPTAASHIAKVIWQLIDKINAKSRTEQAWGTYHYTDHPNVTWYDFATAILTIRKILFPEQSLATKSIIPIKSEEYLTPAVRPINSVLNCGKIKRIFSIEQYNWQDALRLLLSEL